MKLFLLKIMSWDKSCVSQHRLCWDFETEELRHWAEERRNRCWKEKHTCSFGVSYPPPYSAPFRTPWTSVGSAGCLSAHRMLWVAALWRIHIMIQNPFTKESHLKHAVSLGFVRGWDFLQFCRHWSQALCFINIILFCFSLPDLIWYIWFYSTL